MLELALASDLKNFGDDHPTVAVSQSNLGNVYQNLGEYTKAKELLEACLKTQRRLYGDKNVTLLITYTNLSRPVWAFGNHQEALTYGHQALAIAQTQLPSNHPHIEIIKNRVAQMEAAMNKASEDE